MAENGYKLTIGVTDAASGPIQKINQSLEKMHGQGQKVLAPFTRVNKEFAKFTDLTGIRKLSGGIQGITANLISTSKAGSELSKVFNSIGSGIGAATAALTAFTIASAKASVTTLTTSHSLGLQYTQLETLQNVMGRGGMSKEQTNSTLLSMNQAYRNAQVNPGANPMYAGLYKLMTGHTMQSNAQHPYQLTPQTIEQILRYQAGQTNAATRGTGEGILGDTSAEPMLSRGSREVNQYITQGNRDEVARDYSSTASKLVDDLNTLDTKFGVFSSDLAGPLYSGLDKAVQGVTNLVGWLQKLDDEAPDLTSAVASVAALGVSWVAWTKIAAPVLKGLIGAGGKGATKGVVSAAEAVAETSGGGLLDLLTGPVAVGAISTAAAVAAAQLLSNTATRAGINGIDITGEYGPSVPSNGRNGDMNSRNNNPGNMMHWSWKDMQYEDNSYSTYQQGFEANMANLQKNYNGMTLSGLLDKWHGGKLSGSAEQNYLDAVMKGTGLKANQIVNTNDRGMDAKIIRALTSQEGKITPAQQKIADQEVEKYNPTLNVTNTLTVTGKGKLVHTATITGKNIKKPTTVTSLSTR
jgi:hypothetical protein